MKNIQILKEMEHLISISSREKQVREYLKELAKKHDVEVMFDNLGSTFLQIKANTENAKKVMVSFPMDESGYMVSSICETGEIKIVSVSNQTSINLLGQILILETREGKRYEGYSEFPNLDLKDSTKQELHLLEDDCLVHFGFSSKEDAKNQGINIGDSVVIKGDLDFKAPMVITRALDVKLGLFLIQNLLEKSKEFNLDYDLVLGSVVQEKVAYRGAVSTTTSILPDINISLAFESENETYKCGSGVFIKTFDKTTLPNIDMYQFINYNCKVHPQISDFGTSASFIHKSRIGVPSVVMGIHGKNIGLQTQMCHKDDMVSLVEEITNIIKNLSTKDISHFQGCEPHE